VASDGVVRVYDPELADPADHAREVLTDTREAYLIGE
jgi:hypothetical protein